MALGALTGFILLGLAGAAPQGDVPAQKATLVVKVEGLRSDQGAAECTLFAAAEGFPRQREKGQAKAQAKVTGGSARCEFADVAPGTYAVAVFHDENANGQLDVGVLGIPKEGVGYTNVPPRRAPPPPFEKAAQKLGAGRTEASVKLQY